MLSARLLAVQLVCARLGSARLLRQSGLSGVKGVPNFPPAAGWLQIILCRTGESSRRDICFCRGPDPAGFLRAQLLSEIMSMQGCKIGPIMTISWRREKTETIFK